MAKIVKFPLALADGTKARSLEELREHADIKSLVGYFDDKRLSRWLMANYLEDEAEKLEKIQGLVKTEADATMRMKIQKLYDALEIPQPDDTQVESYLAESASSSDSENVLAFNIEVENDADLKEEIAKIIQGKVNLDEWNIAGEKTEEADVYCVQLEHKQFGVYTTFSLKKDENFYLRIAHFIEEFIGKCEKSLNTDFQKIKEYDEDVKKEYQRQLKTQIEAVSNSHMFGKYESVKFGKYSWNVVRTNKKEALLLCEYAIKTEAELKSPKLQIEWLNSNFLKEAFSDDEVSFLKADEFGNKVFLVSKNDIQSFSPTQRVRKLKKSKRAVNWFTSGGYVVVVNGGIISSSYAGGAYGVVPAILVSLEV